MKKQLAIMIICIIFLTLNFSGCEQLFNKSDEVKVNVMLTVTMNVIDEDHIPINISLNGAKVIIEAYKNETHYVPLERFIQNNQCQATYSIELTQGESIECFVTVPNGFNDYYPIANGSAILTWETAQAHMELSGLYNWYPHITIIMMQNSTK